uniref:Ig-like domain-containing protein n=1 Tax=Mesocestoides corti TaxID=53468 RepID=A0A5K3FP09_MESCO
KTGTTKQALLTNHKPEPHFRRLPSESPTLATPLIIYYTSVVSFSGWLLIFLPCHWNADRHTTLVSVNSVSLCVPITWEENKQPTRAPDERFSLVIGQQSQFQCKPSYDGFIELR